MFRTISGKNGIQRLSLEDFNSTQLTTPQVYVSKSSRTIPPGRKRRRYVALPVTYAALLEEARGRSTTTPGKVKGVVWKEWRWRRHARYKPTPKRILPGLGDDIEELEDDPPNVEIHLEKNLGDEEPQEGKALVMDTVARGTQNTLSTDATLLRGSTAPSSSNAGLKANTSSGEGVLNSASGEEGQCDIPTLRSVGSASPAMARKLASTRKVVRALLARSCHAGGERNHDSSLAGRRRERLEDNGFCEARRTACALLAKAVQEERSLEVIGHVVLNERNRQDLRGLGGTPELNMLDEWYEGEN